MNRPSSPAIQNLCLVTAVDVEFKAATALLSSRRLTTESQIHTCRGTIGHRQVTVLQCGMGARGFAQRLSNHLKNHRYDALLVAGLAGGLDPRLKSGDAVIYDCCYDARGALERPGSKEKSSGRDENASIRCDDPLSASLFVSLQSAARRCQRGAGVTVRQIITRASDKARLGDEYRAAAVDMESYDVLSVCAVSGLPTTVLRVISDEAQSDLPDFNWAANADGRLNALRAAVVMAARPSASFRFLRSIGPVLNSLRLSLEVVLNV